MKLPIHILILDLLGCVLVGLGMAIAFANVNFLPASMRFENDGEVYIAVGVALTLPAVLFIARNLRKR